MARKPLHMRGSLARLREYFSDPANVGEYLNYDDIVTKFGLGSRETAMQGVYLLTQEGLIVREMLVYTNPDRPR